MSETIVAAVERLNRILPLKQSQQNLDHALKQLHLDILYSYVDKGRSLNREEIAQRIEDSDSAVRIFQQYDMVVFDDNGEPKCAYPFTMEQRDFKVQVNGHHVYSTCALDSLAISPMYSMEVFIDSVCHLTGEAVQIRQDGNRIINSTDVADVFFAINWSAASSESSCADSLCTEMVFIRDHATAEQWRDADYENRQLFSLPEAVEFAAGFFLPLL